MTILVDTDVLIEILRGRPQPRKELQKLVSEGHRLATTAVNLAEIHAGMRAGEEEKTRALLGELEACAITRELGIAAGRLKQAWSARGRTLSLSDALIAAVALGGGFELMTDNTKDFPMPELRLRSSAQRR